MAFTVHRVAVKFIRHVRNIETWALIQKKQLEALSAQVVTAL